MGKVVKRIVLTGGPCAGKSTSLNLISDYLSNLGYLVLIINETATELISGGIKPFGEDSLSIVEFQEIVLRNQLFKEKLIIDTALKYYLDKEIVIIYDRGMVDYKAYVGDIEYYKLLSKYNLSEDEILDSFDLVIHLETAAKSKDYTNENNRSRSESVNEAIELDNKIYEAWKKHKNFCKIESTDDFLIKQNKIITVISDEL